MIKINFVCVNYNNCELTINYINSILSLNNLMSYKILIFVIDNYSRTDDFIVIEKFCRDFDNIILIRNELNRGYFGGINTAFENGDTAEDSFWIVGNNDISFSATFLDDLNKLRKEFNFDNVLVIAPNILNLDNENQNPVSINRLSLIRRFFLKIYFLNYYIGIPSYILVQSIKKVLNKSSRNYPEIQQFVYLAYGACYILLPRFFTYYNKLDDSTFLYGEEALISNQVHQVGGKILYCPRLKISHSEHGSSDKIESRTRYNITKKAYKQYKSYL